MEIVKKNILSIICGVVALLALVAVFVWPLDGYFDTLKQKAEERAQLQAKVASLRNKSRSLPVFDPNNPTAATLTRFPSADVIKKAVNAVKAVRASAEKMYTEVWQRNEAGHDLVVPGSLPVPVSQPVAIRFRRVLQEALDHLRTDELLAGIPPTPEEVNNRAGVIWESMKKDIIMVDNQATNLDQVMARYQDRVNKLPDEMKKEMAAKNKMYIDPSVVMRVSPSLPADGNSPSKESIWWAQVAYWITHDVAMAIKEVNANSTSVTDSPIKNLVALDINEDFFPPTGVTGAVTPGGAPNVGRGALTDSGEPAATPASGGLPDPTIAIPEGSAETPTRRVSTNLYDVVHFKMTLDIEADKVTLFLKTLPTNRFITVTRVEMNPVDSQLKQIQWYVYGNHPVVTLDLDCEALLMRQWTIKWMPPSLRKALGIPDVSSGSSGKTAMAN